ncbi:hypothetical protein NE237_006973 [Protea cynaroides]|uniref:NHL repeat-containing protein n=1 Tax=Protea cynaroides TaxID=273540 RepID=A0A9Q0QW13_9MAGN|nr:hypothetical protein NE237_006973 [Protea cynaroides]
MAFSSTLIFTLIYVFSIAVLSELVLEEGYTVLTVFDGNKQHIHPYSVSHRPGTDDLIVLDSSGNIFYTVAFPTSEESEIKWFSGNGTEGFSDGDSKSAKFGLPRSFTVDTKGNVYVADRKNHAIRKISKSGVTTIAGGYSKGPGNVDGPGQSASFSDDFDLAFVPERCALLISDSGNSLVRQINLKAEDCAKGFQLGMGLTWIWLVMGLGVLGILGLMSYVLISREVSGHSCFSGTWKHSRIILGRQVLIICSGIRSVVASSRFYSFLLRLVMLIQSYLSHMFRIHRVEHHSFSKEPISLLDSDGANNLELTQQQIFADQLRGLITFNGCPDASERVEVFKPRDENHKGAGVLTDSCGKVDAMRWANIMDFTNEGDQGSLVGCLVGSGPSCLVKRELKLD